MQHRRDRERPWLAIEPAHGSLLLMAGNTQRNWRHGLPKTRRVVDCQLSLTIRRVLGSCAVAH